MPNTSAVPKQLFENHERLVYKTVARLVNQLQLSAGDFDDYMSAGYLGLLEAWDRYEPERGSFETFAFQRIRGAVIDNLRKNSPVHYRAYRVAKRIEGAVFLKQQLELEEERQYGEQSARLASILEFAAKSALLYRLSQSDSEKELLQIPADGDDPELSLRQRQLKEVISECLRQLPPKERAVIQGYYLEDRTFEEIGELLGGVSKSWISRLHTRALSLLKEELIERGVGGRE